MTAPLLPPASPWVWTVDPKQLIASDGSTRTVALTATGQFDDIPTQGDMTATLSFTANAHRLDISGQLTGTFLTQCDRCLAPVAETFTIPIDEPFLWSSATENMLGVSPHEQHHAATGGKSGKSGKPTLTGTYKAKRPVIEIEVPETDSLDPDAPLDVAAFVYDWAMMAWLLPHYCQAPDCHQDAE